MQYFNIDWYKEVDFAKLNNNDFLKDYIDNKNGEIIYNNDFF